MTSKRAKKDRVKQKKVEASNVTKVNPWYAAALLAVIAIIFATLLGSWKSKGVPLHAFIAAKVNLLDNLVQLEKTHMNLSAKDTLFELIDTSLRPLEEKLESTMKMARMYEKMHIQNPVPGGPKNFVASANKEMIAEINKFLSTYHPEIERTLSDFERKVHENFYETSRLNEHVIRMEGNTFISQLLDQEGIRFTFAEGDDNRPMKELEGNVTVEFLLEKLKVLSSLVNDLSKTGDESVADAVRKEIEDNADSYQYTNHYINVKIEAVEQLRHRAKQMFVRNKHLYGERWHTLKGTVNELALILTRLED